MTEPRNDDRSQARREAAALLGVDIDHLSPADGLRIDMVSALRLVIDHEQATVLSGNQADLGKLNVAVQSLIALLPGRELPEPESQGEDPRMTMWLLYKEMRQRGELTLREIPDEEALQAKISEQAREIERLRAQLAGGLAPALPDVPTLIEAMPRGGSTAIDPAEADITPPGEIGGECYAGIRPGPDDPPRRSTRIIEGKAVRPKPPAASAAPPSRPPTWDDTPNGRAWQAWHNAGGNGGGDPWANNNR